MTLVVAFRSIGRIVTLSDTMISDERASRVRNQTPGRLKSIVLNRWLTVSYAGLSTQAIDAIRQLDAIRPSSTDVAIAYLRESSSSLKGDVDYLVCSHESPEFPRLIKISSAQVSEGADCYWIGNQPSASAWARMELPSMPGESGGDHYSVEERRFTRRFDSYVEKGLDTAVGGMVIHSLASPHGHCYQDHAGAYVDRIAIPDPIEPVLRHQMNRAGMDGHFKYNVMSCHERGLAVVGTYFEQADIGFIHEPLFRDDPEKIAVRGQNEFQAILNARARLRLASQPV